jgi:hypothetical protein
MRSWGAVGGERERGEIASGDNVGGARAVTGNCANYFCAARNEAK